MEAKYRAQASCKTQIHTRRSPAAAEVSAVYQAHATLLGLSVCGGGGAAGGLGGVVFPDEGKFYTEGGCVDARCRCEQYAGELSLFSTFRVILNEHVRKPTEWWCCEACRCLACYPPRDVFLPRVDSGLGMRPLLRPVGLVLLPQNRACGGDVGERRGSAVLGLAERFRGCVDPSSCRWNRNNREKKKRWINEETMIIFLLKPPPPAPSNHSSLSANKLNILMKHVIVFILLPPEQLWTQTLCIRTYFWSTRSLWELFLKTFCSPAE